MRRTLPDPDGDEPTAKPAKLTPTSYAVLGMVEIRGPSTTYELQRALSNTIGWIWPVTQTNLYQETRRLQRLGLLSVEEEKGGRRRRTYSSTPEGSQALRTWLVEPLEGAMEIRDLAQVKLLFSELVTEEDVVRLAAAQADYYAGLLEEVTEMEARFKGRKDMARRLSPIRHGQLVYTAAMEFWRDLAENPPRDTAD